MTDTRFPGLRTLAERGAAGPTIRTEARRALDLLDVLAALRPDALSETERFIDDARLVPEDETRELLERAR